ncbi:MAG: DMT family transporter [Erysipelotrichaceae bacterium]|nr:DMT family transporter [Erysipelotrichaceae bacterium]
MYKTSKYEILLIAVISARATSFIFNKLLLQSMSAFNLLSLRFLIAFILLYILFYKDIRSMSLKHILSSIIIGTLFFGMMFFEMLALQQADTSLISLLENSAIIFVPLINIVLTRKLPNKVTIISTIIAMTGVILLALQQGSLTGGFTFGILAGLCYALGIIATDKLTTEDDPSLAIGIIQVGTMGALSLLLTLTTETLVLPQTLPQWGMLAMLILVCTGFGYTLQPVAQSHVSTEKAGLFLSVNPAIAAFLGMIVLHESLGLLGLLGMVLILISILLPYTKICKE